MSWGNQPGLTFTKSMDAETVQSGGNSGGDAILPLAVGYIGAKVQDTVQDARYRGIQMQSQLNEMSTNAHFAGITKDMSDMEARNIARIDDAKDDLWKQSVTESLCKLEKGQIVIEGTVIATGEKVERKIQHSIEAAERRELEKENSRQALVIAELTEGRNHRHLLDEVDIKINAIGNNIITAING